ncbi:hypothetical protein [Azospirillum doebereinerae]
MPPIPPPPARYAIHTSRACNEKCALPLSKAPLPSRERGWGEGVQASAFGGIPLIPTRAPIRRPWRPPGCAPQGEKGYPLAKGAVSLQMRDV